jgi:hypothetical protein
MPSAPQELRNSRLGKATLARRVRAKEFWGEEFRAKEFWAQETLAGSWACRHLVSMTT